LDGEEVKLFFFEPQDDTILEAGREKNYVPYLLLWY